jgi:uncharacterized damage-inducible protein DinB
MNVAELTDLYEYNRWAHELVFESVSDLSKEQYERVVGGSFPSVRLTLEHVLATEVVWLSRWEGHSLGEAPDYSGIADASALIRMWRYFRERQDGFITSLADDELTKPIAIRTRSGIETVQPLCDTMLHVVNHSTYHRGQITNLVRQVGGKPRSTDYFTYILTRGVTSDT